MRCKTTSLISFLLFLAAAAPGSAGEPSASTGVIKVFMTGFESDSGQVGLTLFNRAEGYPSDGKKAFKTLIVRISGQKAYAEFLDLPDGTYAVAVHHDENANGKLDKGLMGIPSEGLGASNNAKAMFGPPRFDDAKFDVGPGVAVQRIKMTYLL